MDHVTTGPWGHPRDPSRVTNRNTSVDRSLRGRWLLGGPLRSDPRRRTLRGGEKPGVKGRTSGQPPTEKGRKSTGERD